MVSKVDCFDVNIFNNPVCSQIVKSIDVMGCYIIDTCHSIWLIVQQVFDRIATIFRGQRNLTLAHRSIVQLFTSSYISAQEYLKLKHILIDFPTEQAQLKDFYQKLKSIDNLEPSFLALLNFRLVKGDFYQFMAMVNEHPLCTAILKDQLKSILADHAMRKRLPEFFKNLVQEMGPKLNIEHKSYLHDLEEKKEWKKLLMIAEYGSIINRLKPMFRELNLKKYFKSIEKIQWSQISYENFKLQLNKVRNWNSRIALSQFINGLNISNSNMTVSKSILTIKEKLEKALLCPKDNLSPDELRNSLINLLKYELENENDSISHQIIFQMIQDLETKALFQISDLIDIINPAQEVNFLFDVIDNMTSIDQDQSGESLKNLYKIHAEILNNIDIYSNKLVESLKTGLVRRYWRLCLENNAVENKHSLCDCDLSDHYKFRTLDIKKIIKAPSAVEITAHKLDSKKIILIPVATGGGGHIAASKAITGYLDPSKYHIISVDVQSDVLVNHDPLHLFSKKFGSGTANFTDYYRWLMEKGLTGILNPMLRPFFPRSSRGLDYAKSLFDAKLIDEVRSLFVKIQPDIIVPVYHTHVKIMTKIAQEMGLPLIHVQTDFIYFIDWMEDPSYENFRNAFPMLGEPMEIFNEEQLNRDLIIQTGYPTRKPFLERPSDEQIQIWRQEEGMTPEAHAVMILNGATCVHSPFPEQIVKIKENFKQPVHVFVACGNNKKVMQELELLNNSSETNPMVTIHPLPYMSGDEVNKYLTLSDIAIGKPGGGFSNEVLRTQTYFLVDNTISLHLLELSNLEIIEKMEAGQRLTPDQNFSQIFKDLIDNPPRKFLENALYSHVNGVRPDKEFPKLIDKLIEDTSEDIERRRMHDVMRFLA